MDLFAFPPVAAALTAVVDGLTALAGVLASVAPGWGAALAVVVTTLAVRAVLVPLGVRQVRAQLARARLAPRLAELQKRFRRNPKRLQRETLALYRREGVSPFAGVLPALVQLPVVALLAAAFLHPQVGGGANGLLAESLLGVPLGDSWLVVLGSAAAWPGGAVGLAVLGAIAATAWFARRQLLRSTPSPIDPRVATMARVGASLPFATVVVGAVVPLAAAIYFAVSSAWSVAERTVLRRLLSEREPGAAKA